jgi:hypothetical protein
VLGGPHEARGQDIAQACTRVSLSVQGESLVIGTCPRPRYWYILSLFINTKKWPGPGSRYPYSEWITRYVWINFVPIVNQIRGMSRYPYCTDNKTLV